MGVFDGCPDGIVDGDELDLIEGPSDGWLDSVTLGAVEGMVLSDGWFDAVTLGAVEGMVLGTRDIEGTLVGVGLSTNQKQRRYR